MVRFSAENRIYEIMLPRYKPGRRDSLLIKWRVVGLYYWGDPYAFFFRCGPKTRGHPNKRSKMNQPCIFILKKIIF
ncbi:protein kinase of the PI-3 kinase family [Pseudoloma neurophilia]|uniref:Protein kinase of the PI-3 kinase family n=1 Tax=Pseudoloma neurophilia TaxID=146866 RepID=A0A0R0M145_9MICR|nr:protein kinase of the PI-3 kinase family [Pseudoloma neurophilia]